MGAWLNHLGSQRHWVSTLKPNSPHSEATRFIKSTSTRNNMKWRSQLWNMKRTHTDLTHQSLCCKSKHLPWNLEDKVVFKKKSTCASFVFSCPDFCSKCTVFLPQKGTQLKNSAKLIPHRSLILLASLDLQEPRGPLDPGSGDQCWPLQSSIIMLLCSVAKLCLTLWDPMDCSPPGFPVPHHLKLLSRRLLKLMSIVSVMPSNHLILCRPLLILPSVFPSIKVFSNGSALPIRWPK